MIRVTTGQFLAFLSEKYLSIEPQFTSSRNEVNREGYGDRKKQ